MWPVFVINMADAVARRAAVTAELAAAGVAWTRVEAVAGRDLTAAERAAAYDADRNRRLARHPLVAAEIGCYLSHVAAWRRIDALDLPGAIVLEDDVRVTGDLAGAIAALAADAPSGGWDICKLFAFAPPPRDGVRDLGRGFSIGWPAKVPTTALAYAVTREGARKLLARSLPFFRPVDEDHKFFWEYDLNVAMLAPQVVEIGQQAAESGTVGEARRRANRSDPRSVLERGLATFRYQWRYHIGLRRARRRRLESLR